MIQKTTIKFLEELQENNNKPWFDENRKVYETAKENFIQFVEELIAQLSLSDASINHIKPKETLFRINRDIRFSKDKRPYKKNFASSINAYGKKSSMPGYYFHLEPGNKSFIGGGVWQPEPAQLSAIRQEIDYNFNEWKLLAEDKKMLKVYGGFYKEEGSLLQRVPKGYDADNPAAEYLKLKNFLVLAPISDKELCKKELLAETVKKAELLLPLFNFLNRALNIE